VLIILTTHPIQYQVPLWQALARDTRIPFEIWYLTQQATQVSRDREFGKSFAWDLDMLSGYPHRFLDVDPSATPNNFLKCRVRGDFAELLREAGAKAVWIQGWQVAAYWQAAWSAKRIGAEVWLRGESNDLAPVPFWKRPIKRVVLGQLFRRVDRFLYIGTANRRLYERYGVPKERLYSAPYAVDNERFARQAEEIRNSKSPAYAQGSGVAGRSGIRTQWKIPEDAFCVLFCGKFIPKKRPVDVVKAAQSLITNNRLPNIHLLFAGSGELGHQLRANCNVVFDAELDKRSEASLLRAKAATAAARGQKSGIGEQITDNQKPRASFAGFLNQTEISKAYVAADCLALPSDYRETWGLVVNEAMASGLPCIISDQCGCAEDLGSGTANLVFSCANTAEIAKHILKTAASHKARAATRVHLPSVTETTSTAVSLYQALSWQQKASVT
jgi:glycosyltransferase involved in cell wall biosynthesis